MWPNLSHSARIDWRRDCYGAQGTPWQLTQALCTINTKPKLVFAALVSWTISHFTCSVPLPLIQFQWAWSCFCSSSFHVLALALFLWFSVFLSLALAVLPAIFGLCFGFNVLTNHPNSFIFIPPDLTCPWFLLPIYSYHSPPTLTCVSPIDETMKSSNLWYKWLFG